MALVLTRIQRNVTTIPMSNTSAGSFSVRKKDPSQNPYVDEALMSP